MTTATPTSFHGLDALQAAVGTEIGVSEWYDLTQSVVDAFAHATGDLNPIHVDPVVAGGSGFGGTIAHGLLTLSLGPRFNYALFDVTGVGTDLNYGYDRVRFPAPVPVPSRLRMRLHLDAVEAVGGGAAATFTQTFEREGGERPVCVATFLLRFVPEAA